MTTAATLSSLVNSSSQVVVPSGGISFSDSTTQSVFVSDEHVIGQNEYEFGVFTPSVTGSSSSPSGVNYAVRSGNYIKIGKLVSVRVTLYFSSITTEGTGQFYATGLPYLLANSGNDFNSYFHPVFYNLQASVSNPIGLLRTGTNQIEFFRDAFGTGGFNSMTWESHIKSTTFCFFEFSYTTS